MNSNDLFTLKPQAAEQFRIWSDEDIYVFFYRVFSAGRKDRTSSLYLNWIKPFQEMDSLTNIRQVHTAAGYLRYADTYNYRQRMLVKNLRSIVMAKRSPNFRCDTIFSGMLVSISFDRMLNGVVMAIQTIHPHFSKS